MVGRRGEHAAGAAGRVEDVDDLSLAGNRVLVRGDQQVDHQLDDLARGEVLTGGLVGVLGELPDQVLEDVAHLVVRELVQVLHRGEFPDDLVEQLRLGQPGDLVVEAELAEDLPDVLREAVDVVAQVLRDAGRVGGDGREVLLRDVVERQPRGPLQQLFLVLHAERGVAGTHRLARRRHHRVQPPEHRERQDHLAVFVPLVIPAQQVGHGPDVGRHLLVRWSRSHRLLVSPSVTSQSGARTPVVNP